MSLLPGFQGMQPQREEHGRSDSLSRDLGQLPPERWDKSQEQLGATTSLLKYPGS